MRQQAVFLLVFFFIDDFGQDFRRQPLHDDVFILFIFVDDFQNIDRVDELDHFRQLFVGGVQQKIPQLFFADF